MTALPTTLAVMRVRQRQRPRLRASLVVVSLAGACSREAPPLEAHPVTPGTGASAAAPTLPARAAIDDDDPLADLASPVRDDEMAPAYVAPLTRPRLEAGRCAEVADAPVRVLPHASAAALLQARDRFFLAAYEPLDAGRERVSVVEIEPGRAPRLVTTLPVEPPTPANRRTAPPALATMGEPGADARLLGLAFTDANGRLHAAFFDPARPSPRASLVGDASADPRFAPALARTATGARLVAVTEAARDDAVEERDAPRTLRVRFARLDSEGRAAGWHDLTPPAGSASHPSFVATPDGGVDLLFVDARVALSVLHRVHVDAEGRPGEPTVVRPINLLAEPASFAVARIAGRELLAYAATGNLATRAVGLVDLAGTEPPTALVPGLGYGQPLTVRVGPLGQRSAVFALEAPSAPSPNAPHEVRIRTVTVNPEGATNLGEPLVLAGASRPAIATLSDGTIALAVEGGLVHWLRCAE